MRTDIELRVHLKIPDVTALTAKHALQRSLGYDEWLVDLERADYWRLALEADSEQAALDLARELAERTNLFANPNKHAYQATRAGDGAAAAQDPAPSPPFRINVLVTSPADTSGAAACRALQGRLGYKGRVHEVTSGTLWTLTLNTTDREHAEQLAREMTVTDRIDRGLLCNPHYQDFVITSA